MTQPLSAFTAPEHHPFSWKGENGAALLVHGFPGTPAEMRPLARVLNEAGWTAEGILLPGFGAEIEQLGDLGYPDWLAAVQEHALRLREEHGRLLLVGNSMGAALCLAAASQLKPDGLILFSPFWRLRNQILNALAPVIKWFVGEIHPWARVDLTASAVRADLERVMPGVDLDDPRVEEQVREIGLPTRLLAEVVTCGRVAYRVAPTVEAPSIVLQGIGDETVARTDTNRLAHRLPALSALVEVQGGHDLVRLEGDSARLCHRVVVDFAERCASGLEPVRTR